MDCLQLVAMQFFGQRLQPACNVSDHSDGLRVGMSFINISNAEREEEDEELELTPHFSDWAHIAVHHQQGRLLLKSNPYYGPTWPMLQGVHVTHTAEQRDLLMSVVREVFDEWRDYGEDQPGKYTTETLWKTHFEPPWRNWAIGSFDRMGSACLDLPGILPSAQCHESWHKKIKKLLKNKQRQSTKVSIPYYFSSAPLLNRFRHI